MCAQSVTLRAVPFGSNRLEIAHAVIEVVEGKTGADAAVATVVQRRGSAPQTLGAQLLLHEDGRQIGTVGGGAIEARVLEACRQTLRNKRAQSVEHHLVRDLGMCCGGSMEVFVDIVRMQPRILIVGGGHVAQALAPLLPPLEFRVFVAEDREEQLDHPSFVNCTCLAYDADELSDAVPDLGETDYAVIITRDHERDEKALDQLLERPLAYLGMIGSQRKVRTVVDRVLRRREGLGRKRPKLSHLHAPIGLRLGGRSPAEIALSIAAELVAVRYRADARPMSIHEQL